MTMTAVRTESTQTGASRRVAVRVWQLPVRVIHWLLVASVIVLTVTGLYIGTPVLSLGGRSHQIMAYIRAIHIGFGFLLLALIIARVIFAFTGNKYARWDQFVPARKERQQLLIPSLRFYTFLDHEPPPAVGHNPLAGATYVIVFGMFLVQAITGIALQAVVHHSGFLWAVSGWVFHVLPIAWVRFVHHLIMWLTWGFVINHVYSSILMESVERSGLISSMINGWKYVPKDHL